VGGEPSYYHESHELWKITEGPQKNSNLKSYQHLHKENKESKLWEAAMEASLDLLSKNLFILKFRFDPMLCCNLDKGKFWRGSLLMLMWAACSPALLQKYVAPAVPRCRLNTTIVFCCRRSATTYHVILLCLSVVGAGTRSARSPWRCGRTRQREREQHRTWRRVRRAHPRTTAHRRFWKRHCVARSQCYVFATSWAKRIINHPFSCHWKECSS